MLVLLVDLVNFLCLVSYILSHLCSLLQARENELAKQKAGKVRPVAKSVVVIDVKPWEDTTGARADAFFH